ncbi:tumor protein p53-inducible protein 11-like [Lethenteron reissneri]|uniref:tumor protein p53-inducible protein 11-like n=1 Tax=Lethenteron reissneri TaxID=7753 RepID=UPI002AB7872E|nr:tumor protein p53-inducible protein 11-like [Lethenteron reissneri]
MADSDSNGGGGCIEATGSSPTPPKAPCPLLKKNSQTDLLSRLKTRKVLGVGGEDDEGEAHRSKISQVLGNESKFGLREPLGLRLWQLVSATMFTVIAGMALVIPDKLYEVLFEERSTQGSLSMRLYGGTLLCISLVLWNAFYTADKAIIRWSLALQASYFIVQMGVTVFAVWERGTAPENLALLLSSRALFTLVACFYHRSVGRRTKKQH